MVIFSLTIIIDYARIIINNQKSGSFSANEIKMSTDNRPDTVYNHCLDTVQEMTRDNKQYLK